MPPWFQSQSDGSSAGGKKGVRLALSAGGWVNSDSMLETPNYHRGRIFPLLNVFPPPPRLCSLSLSLSRDSTAFSIIEVSVR